jgi:ABC-type thiamin/hydroxymethylpyrimidine transport system permease subunit
LALARSFVVEVTEPMTAKSETLPRHYFATRDLLVMAVFAGLGGVASTAITAVGATIRAVVGIVGVNQWAAGLHIVPLLLAASLTGRPGAGTVTGLLKGGVELLSGNTHGAIVLLVNLVGGILIDIIFLLLRRREGLPALGLAGGLSAASNVFVFQLFVSAPQDVLRFIWAIAALALASGVFLGGGLAQSLLGVLRKNGLLGARTPVAPIGWRYPLFLLFAALLTIGAGVYLSHALAGPPEVAVEGDVAAPYAFWGDPHDARALSLEVDQQGMRRRVTGVPLAAVVEAAAPLDGWGAVLVTASDGYAFFVTREEVEANPSLLLAYRGEDDSLTYEIAGARNAKAWVRNVREVRVVREALIEVSGLVDRPFPYNPDDWQFSMENGYLDLGQGEVKLQGTLLREVLQRWEPSRGAEMVAFVQRDGNVAALPLGDALGPFQLRIWSVMEAEGIRYAVGEEGVPPLAVDVVAIEIR